MSVSVERQSFASAFYLLLIYALDLHLYFVPQNFPQQLAETSLQDEDTAAVPAESSATNSSQSVFFSTN